MQDYMGDEQAPELKMFDDLGVEDQLPRNNNNNNNKSTKQGRY